MRGPLQQQPPPLLLSQPCAGRLLFGLPRDYATRSTRSVREKSRATLATQQLKTDAAAEKLTAAPSLEKKLAILRSMSGASLATHSPTILLALGKEIFGKKRIGIYNADNYSVRKGAISNPRDFGDGPRTFVKDDKLVTRRLKSSALKLVRQYPLPIIQSAEDMGAMARDAEFFAADYVKALVREDSPEFLTELSKFLQEKVRSRSFAAEQSVPKSSTRSILFTPKVDFEKKPIDWSSWYAWHLYTLFALSLPSLGVYPLVKLPEELRVGSDACLVFEPNYLPLHADLLPGDEFWTNLYERVRSLTSSPRSSPVHQDFALRPHSVELSSVYMDMLASGLPFPKKHVSQKAAEAHAELRAWFPHAAIPLSHLKTHASLLRNFMRAIRLSTTLSTASLEAVSEAVGPHYRKLMKAMSVKTVLDGEAPTASAVCLFDEMLHAAVCLQTVENYAHFIAPFEPMRNCTRRMSDVLYVTPTSTIVSESAMAKDRMTLGSSVGEVTSGGSGVSAQEDEDWQADAQPEDEEAADEAVAGVETGTLLEKFSGATLRERVLAKAEFLRKPNASVTARKLLQTPNLHHSESVMLEIALLPASETVAYLQQKLPQLFQLGATVETNMPKQWIEQTKGKQSFLADIGDKDYHELAHSAPFLHSKALSALQSDQPELALQYAEQAIAASPDNAFQYETKARTQYQLGDFDGAYATLEQMTGPLKTLLPKKKDMSFKTTLHLRSLIERIETLQGKIISQLPEEARAKAKRIKFPKLPELVALPGQLTKAIGDLNLQHANQVKKAIDKNKIFTYRRISNWWNDYINLSRGLESQIKEEGAVKAAEESPIASSVAGQPTRQTAQPSGVQKSKALLLLRRRG